MKEGIGRAIFYILILSLIVGGAKGIANVVKVNLSANETIEKLKDEKYQFKIKDDVMDIATSPVKIENDNTIVYIDKDITLEQAKNLKSMIVNSDVYILILKDGIVSNASSTEMKNSYRDLGLSQMDEEINNQYVINLITNLKNPIYLLIIIMTIIKIFIGYLITTLLIATFSIISSKLLNLNLRLGELFSLVAYIGTLPNILITILGIIMPTVVFSTAGIVGTAVYTGLIINTMKKEMDEDIKIQ
jgi:hypothetical protein